MRNLNCTKFYKATILAAVALSTTASFAEPASNKVKLLNVRAYGDACKLDKNGDPDDFFLEFDRKTKNFNVTFSDFILGSETPERNCRLTLVVLLPSGKTQYRVKTAATGTTFLKARENIEISTSIRFSKKSKDEHKHLVPQKTNGSFETEQTSFTDSKTAPCGGREYRLVIDFKGKLKNGATSDATIETLDGKISNFIFEPAENC